MYQSLSGKVAVVTGGSRGIGAGIAKDLANRGAQVMITFVSATSKATDVVSEIQRRGGSAAMVQADCAEQSSPQRVVDATLDAFKAGIDIVVNNAGTPDEGMMTEITYEQYNKTLDVFLRFPIFLVQAALPHMKSGARIINIGSETARKAWPGCTLYCAAKAGVESLTRSWQVELAKQHGITTTTINLGKTETDSYSELAACDTRRANGAVGALPDVLTVEEVAETVGYLCETRSRLLQGSVLTADLSIYYNPEDVGYSG